MSREKNISTKKMFNDKWKNYAEFAALSYKSEQQISYWRLSREKQYSKFLQNVTIGPFKSVRDTCEFSYALVDDELIISFPGTREMVLQIGIHDHKIHFLLCASVKNHLKS